MTQQAQLVFPPCDTKELFYIPLEPRKEKIILSVAQFRFVLFLLGYYTFRIQKYFGKYALGLKKTINYKLKPFTILLILFQTTKDWKKTRGPD
jgi:hypothetical protein